jgi:hypothetical protein
MTLYTVTWEIQIEADTPRQAAETARAWLLDPGAECVIFGVKEFESPEDEELIDLLEEECD